MPAPLYVCFYISLHTHKHTQTSLKLKSPIKIFINVVGEYKKCFEKTADFNHVFSLTNAKF
jgi:hypothetical protein